MTLQVPGRKGYAPEVRVQAEGLFVFDGLTLEEVAEAVGVSLGTAKRWSEKGQWASQRKAMTALARGVAPDLAQLYQHQMAKAKKTKDNQDIQVALQLAEAIERIRRKSA